MGKTNVLNFLLFFKKENGINLLKMILVDKNLKISTKIQWNHSGNIRIDKKCFHEVGKREEKYLKCHDQYQIRLCKN